MLRLRRRRPGSSPLGRWVRAGLRRRRRADKLAVIRLLVVVVVKLQLLSSGSLPKGRFACRRVQFTPPPRGLAMINIAQGRGDHPRPRPGSSWPRWRRLAGRLSHSESSGPAERADLHTAEETSGVAADGCIDDFYRAVAQLQGARRLVTLFSLIVEALHPQDPNPRPGYRCRRRRSLCCSPARWRTTRPKL